MGPTEGDPYVGPALGLLDQVVESAQKAGLQVLLDLHGNPGGETADRPCGHKWRRWSWRCWRRDEALEVLRQVAVRYRDSECVTGVQVCNEPSESIPVEILCDHYERAVSVIRAAGMGPERVVVVLAAFSSFRITEVSREWRRRGNFLRYDNVAFDLHYYHCFSPIWQLQTHHQHLDICEDHGLELGSLPAALVGEWSIARQASASRFTEEEKASFAMAQVRAYSTASHGWFFWNWHDHETYDLWDMRRGVFGRGRLPERLEEAVETSAGTATAGAGARRCSFWASLLRGITAAWDVLGPICGPSPGRMPSLRAFGHCFAGLTESIRRVWRSRRPRAVA